MSLGGNFLDFSCKFSKLQYNSLAFVAGFKRATDEGSLPEIAQYSPSYLPLNVFIASKGSNLYISFSSVCVFGTSCSLCVPSELFVLQLVYVTVEL